jgi:hypothetical protein
LKTISIPIYTPERMEELGQRVKNAVQMAVTARQEATQLLEDAKRQVEDMILANR